MKFYVLIIISLFFYSGFSQNISVIYFDKQWKEVESKEKAYYYRSMEAVSDTQYIVRDFYINDSLLMLGSYYSLEPEVKHGKFLFWYKNGQLAEEGLYVKNFKFGPWKQYYENGAFRSERTYDGKEIIFRVVDQMPEYTGGPDSLARYLSNNIYYPTLAKDSKIQGVVFVSFIIDEEGNIAETELIKGIGGGCDEEALNVVNKMPKWQPGMNEGKPVKVQYILPVRFKL